MRVAQLTPKSEETACKLSAAFLRSTYALLVRPSHPDGEADLLLYEFKVRPFDGQNWEATAKAYYERLKKST